TYDHRIMNTELPVCSAVLKHDTGGLVVRWVTTSEYLLLYVFGFFLSFFPLSVDPSRLFLDYFLDCGCLSVVYRHLSTSLCVTYSSTPVTTLPPLEPR
ncbi:hypothetical protein P280DRAFT_412025, partial [Massarina eburnea CBS 473.64]